MSKQKIISEEISLKNTSLENVFTGDFTKIRTGLDDLEKTFGNIYQSLEIKTSYPGYDGGIELELWGSRLESKEEAEKRITSEEKERNRVLEQLEKDKVALDKKMKSIEQKLAKLGAKP